MAQVYVVDDDEAIRDSLAWLLEGNGIAVASFGSAQEFLAAYAITRDAKSDQTGGACLVLDVRMPGMTGMQLQEELIGRGIALPVIFITGHGDVPMAVEAVKKGAFDFIEKPFGDEQLVAVIRRALERETVLAQQREEDAQIEHRFAQLTTREREVLDLVVAGKLNKTIADALGISAKTVEVHRARVMEKMRAGSLAELVQLALKRPHA